MMDMIIEGDGSNGILLLAHGAGMPMDHPFMQNLSDCFVGIGLVVVRFEFPYMQHRRATKKQKFPDKIALLEQSYIEAYQQVRKSLATEKTPIFLAGKSLGGRVATLIANRVSISAVFAIGYPFHPISKPETLRVAHLKDVLVPVYIFQGERDKFGTKAEVLQYSLGEKVSLHWFEDADHDLAPRKRSGYTKQQHIAKLCSIVQSVVKR